VNPSDRLILVKASAALLALLFAPFDASAQDLNRPDRIPRKRYACGILVVRVKEGSIVDQLRLRPEGSDLFIVEVNDRLVPAVAGTPHQLADCTAIHDALSARGPIRLGLVVRTGGKRVLIELEVPEWDQGLIYQVKKMAGDPATYTFPGASKEIADAFESRHSYSEIERRVEVADFDRLKRDKEAKSRNPELGLKSLESFKAVQRKIRIDSGAASPLGKEEEEYVEARQDLANRYALRASECNAQKMYFEYFLAAMGADAMDGSSSAIAAAKRKLAALDEAVQRKLRVQASVESGVSLKAKRHVESGLAAAFGKMLGDEESTKNLEQARRAAFAAPEMSKADFDQWWNLLGGLDSLSDGEAKIGEPRRFEGRVVKPGPFTVFAAGEKKWVFEDKIGLRFDEGDVFIAVAVPDVVPGGLPEDVRSNTYVRLVVIR
jgi:hypothetical protein